MNRVLAWLNTQTRGRRRATLLMVAVADLALVLLTGLVGLDAIAPFVGGIAGVVLFGVALCGYLTVLTEAQQSRANLKNRLPVQRRRGLVFVLAAVWVIALLLSSRAIPDGLDTLVGSLSVFVVCSLVMLYRLSPVEEIDAEIKAGLDGEDGRWPQPTLRRRRRS